MSTEPDNGHQADLKVRLMPGREARPAKVAATACAIAMTTALATGAQQPAPVADTAILAGQAVDAVTGAPVANTLIGLSQRAGSGPNTTPTAPNTQLVLVLADSQGRFVVRDVPKGSFLILATAPGYIVSNYGQARAAGPTRTVDLTGGERLVNLKIPLWRHGVISGTVRDEAGEPVVGATVRVLRKAPNGPGGQPRYQPGTETTTDDRGQYRLTMLTPGQFLVTVPQTQVTVPASIVDTFLQSMAGRGGGSASGQMLDLMSSSSAVPSVGGGVRIDNLLLQSSGNGRQLTVPPPTLGSLLVYPTTFYGTGASAAQSEVIVGPGEERSGIDIHLRPGKAVRVSGTITADGSPVSGLSVRLVRTGGPPIQNENGWEAAATVSGADGTFTLLGVTSGQYVLKVLKTPRITLPPTLAANPAIVAAYSPSGAAPPAGGPPPIGAQVAITIGETDVRDLLIALRPGASVSGQVLIKGTTPTPQQMQGFGVLLSSEDGGLPGAGLQIARPSATGAFKITAPAPGRYLVTTLGPPAAGWRLGGVLVDGKPLTGPIDLTGDDVTAVSLVYTDEVAEVSGTVRAASGAPISTAGLVVFSTDRTAWIQEPLNPRQPRIEQTSTGGAFRLAGLLPGEYFLAAVEDADVPDFASPAFLEAVVKVATRVTLAANAKVSQALTVRSVK